jgi:Cdc6-like AAA superfamily ATPase
MNHLLMFALAYISKVADWLTPANFSAQQSDIIARRQEGTGLWLLNSNEYKMWIEGKEQTLFCPGIPGAGKTVMSSIVVDDLRKTFDDSDRIGISYLFCSYKRQNEQRSANLLASLLKQLVQERPELPNVVQDLYKEHSGNKPRPSFDELSNTFQSVVKDCYSRVFLVIDALDESTNASGVRDLLREIFTLQNHIRISLFATSRFIPEIEREFDGSLRLEIRASDQDVQRYVEGHMPEQFCVQRNPDMQEKIKTEIIKAADGMYVPLKSNLSGLNWLMLALVSPCTASLRFTKR